MSNELLRNSIQFLFVLNFTVFTFFSKDLWCSLLIYCKNLISKLNVTLEIFSFALIVVKKLFSTFILYFFRYVFTAKQLLQTKESWKQSTSERSCLITQQFLEMSKSWHRFATIEMVFSSKSSNFNSPYVNDIY
jgi:hypothetical protein